MSGSKLIERGLACYSVSARVQRRKKLQIVDLVARLSRNKCKYADNCDLVELIDYKEGRDS
jgi:hypothetical protein